MLWFFSCAVFLASCAFPSPQSAHDRAAIAALNFQLPRGWIRETGPLEVPVWTSLDRTQSIAIFRTPGTRLYADTELGRTSTPIVICGKKPAFLMHRPPLFSHVQGDGVKTSDGGALVSAWYTYPANATPDPSAASAIRRLCRPSTSSG